MKEQYDREIKTGTIGLTAYFLTILFIAFYRNSFNILSFCGSLHDFNGDTAAEVCLSLPEYLYRASTHPDFALPASIIALILGLGYYGEVWKYIEKLRQWVK